jgi:rare lipoprotein A
MKIGLLPVVVVARRLAIVAAATALVSVRVTSHQEVRTPNSHVQKGTAAFYSGALEGHKTACGGTYVASELTTAHRSLPCGTKVKITNTKNGKSVVATVNDWGPRTRKRIVDVSRAVAERLDFVKQGTTTVKVQIVQ